MRLSYEKGQSRRSSDFPIARVPPDQTRDLDAVKRLLRLVGMFILCALVALWLRECWVNPPLCDSAAGTFSLVCVD